MHKLDKKSQLVKIKEFCIYYIVEIKYIKE